MLFSWFFWEDSSLEGSNHFGSFCRFILHFSYQILMEQWQQSSLTPCLPYTLQAHPPLMICSMPMTTSWPYHTQNPIGSIEKARNLHQKKAGQITSTRWGYLLSLVIFWAVSALSNALKFFRRFCWMSLEEIKSMRCWNLSSEARDILWC